ncbi:MAG: TadE/TadG family type IV pilus assembly protein [Candidatus Limnocylindrales bacterium]
MTRVTSTRRGASVGQALVEFALVFPVLIMILFGLVHLGRAVYAYSTIANAARTGARVAIVNQTIYTASSCTAVQSIEQCAAAQAVALGIDPASVQVQFVPENAAATCTPVQLGCLAEITVPYTFRPITPVLGNLTIAMSATSEMPVESTYVNP